MKTGNCQPLMRNALKILEFQAAGLQEASKHAPCSFVKKPADFRFGVCFEQGEHLAIAMLPLHKRY